MIARVQPLTRGHQRAAEFSQVSVVGCYSICVGSKLLLKYRLLVPQSPEQIRCCEYVLHNNKELI
jgi:hypothetical protein